MEYGMVHGIQNGARTSSKHTKTRNESCVMESNWLNPGTVVEEWNVKVLKFRTSGL